MTTTPQGRLFIEQAEKLLHSAAQIENPTDALHGSFTPAVGLFH